MVRKQGYGATGLASEVGIPLQERRYLHTRIVATLGSIARYRENGIFDLDGSKISSGDITPDFLIKRFFALGVNIVRLNFAHVAPKEVRDVLEPIKRAILAADRRSLKKMAVLVDLPGPKIRLKLEERILDLAPGDVLTLQLGRAPKGSGSEEVCVYIGDKSIKDSLTSEGATSLNWSTTEVDDRDFENLLGTKNAAGSIEVPSDPFDHLLASITPRIQVVLGDGDVVLSPVGSADVSSDNAIPCRVLSARKRLTGKPSVTFKGVDLDVSSFTAYDRKLVDEILAVDYEKNSGDPVVAFVGISFAQTACDILRARSYIEKKLCRLPRWTPSRARLECPAIIAKVETKKGVDNRDHILDVADGIMVARGDLGLQMDFEEVPAIHKMLVRTANQRGKPVITATEMLKTMTNSLMPLRAEASDVFNAVLDGTDATMMSDETAVGLFPFHTIRTMVRILFRAEAEWFFLGRELAEDRRLVRMRLRRQQFMNEDFIQIKHNEERLNACVSALESFVGGGLKVPRAWLKWLEAIYREKHGKALNQAVTNRVTQSACVMSEEDKFNAIVAASTSGRTVRMIARMRPEVPVIGVVHDAMNLRKLAVTYGVFGICVKAAKASTSVDDLFQMCEKEFRKHAFLARLLRDENPDVIFTAGTPMGNPGTTNVIHLERLGKQGRQRRGPAAKAWRGSSTRGGSRSADA